MTEAPGASRATWVVKALALKGPMGFWTVRSCPRGRAARPSCEAACGERTTTLKSVNGVALKSTVWMPEA